MENEENNKPTTDAKPEQAEKKAGKTTGRETHWSARQLALMSISIALGTLLAFIAIPLIPGAPTLTYDPGNVPAIIGGFVFGPVAGCIIGVFSLLLHFLFSGDNPVGPVINAVLLMAFIVPAALIYRRKRTIKWMIIGLVVGCLAAMVLVIPANLVAWYVYAGMPVNVTLPFIIASVLPFNVLKLLSNSILSFVLYLTLYKLLVQYETPSKGHGAQVVSLLPGDSRSIGYVILGFFMPLVGLILFLLWKSQFPQKASSCGKGALIGVCVGWILPLIVILFR